MVAWLNNCFSIIYQTSRIKYPQKFTQKTAESLLQAKFSCKMCSHAGKVTWFISWPARKNKTCFVCLVKLWNGKCRGKKWSICRAIEKTEVPCFMSQMSLWVMSQLADQWFLTKIILNHNMFFLHISVTYVTSAISSTIRRHFRSQFSIL